MKSYVGMRGTFIRAHSAFRAWLLPLLAIGFGIALVRRSGPSVLALAWYCGGAAMIAGLWSAATFVALDLMYVRFDHNL
jgi:hypothetical protein